MAGKVFVTGGTGFLGLNVIQTLLEKDYEVYAMVRSVENKLTALGHPRLKTIVGDLEHVQEMDVPSFDVCLSFAWGGVNRAEISNTDIQRQNMLNEEALWHFAEAHGCRLFVDAGSRQEYSFSDEALTEESDCHPLSEYGKGKLAAYQALAQVSQQSPMKYVHPRIFSIYGYGDHPWSLINSSIDKMRAGEDMDLGECLHQWSFLHIEDLAAAFIAIIEQAESLDNNEVLNVGSNVNKPLRYFVEAIKSICSSSSKLNYGAFQQNPESVKSIICDASKLTRKTGWQEQVTFEKGIRQIIENKITHD